MIISNGTNFSPIKQLVAQLIKPIFGRLIQFAEQ